MKISTPFLLIIHLWKDIGRDLFKRLLPGKSNQTGFAFIVHPRSYIDVVENVRFFRLLPEWLGKKILRFLWPITIARINGVYSLHDDKPIQGWIIAVPLLPKEMFKRKQYTCKRIGHAVTLAKKQGAKVVGLGALTGTFSLGGLLVKSDYMTVTAGRAYTAVTVVSYVHDVIHKFGLSHKTVTIAIVGAGGGVGSNVARLLALQQNIHLILIDIKQKIKSVHALPNGLKNTSSIEVTTDNSKMKKAHIVVTTTNAPEAVINSCDISSGTVCIDDAQPSDIGHEVIKREDVLVIEGGVIQIPKIEHNVNFGLVERTDAYSCLGETIAISAADLEEIGNVVRVNKKTVEEISDIARKLGFSISQYQLHGHVIPQDKIDYVKTVLNDRFNI